MSSSPQSQQSARKIFKYVSGVLNGAFPTTRVTECAEDINLWGNTTCEPSFESACEALTLAIEAGLIPSQGMEVLKSLVVSPQDHACRVPTSLRRLLVPSEKMKQMDAVDAAQSDTSIGSDLADETSSLHSDRPFVSLHEKLRLRVGDYADFGLLPSSCSLRDKLLGPDEQNVKFITEETGMQLTLEENDGHLEICISSSGSDCTRAQLDDAVEMAKDLIKAATSFPSEALAPKEAEKQHGGAVELQAGRAEAQKECQEEKATEQKPKSNSQSSVNRLFQYVTKVASGVKPELPQEADIRYLIESPTGNSSEPLESGASFSAASQLLAQSVCFGAVPSQGVIVLVGLRHSLAEHGACDLVEALKAFLCPACGENPPRASSCDTCSNKRTIACGRCAGSGRFAPPCRSCNGTGFGRSKFNPCGSCKGSGKKDLGSCNGCQGAGASTCQHCVSNPSSGRARPLCSDCVSARQQVAQQVRPFQPRRQEIPKPGMTIERCSAGDLSRLRQLWATRGGFGDIMEAWKVDNPLRTYIFKQRRETLKAILGREADGLEGFHGTHPDAVVPICEGGFDKSRRSGQVYGAGEYFAKNPSVSVGYCRGGEYMLVCRLTLGEESSTPQNIDGDHIWVPSTGYYVIKEPDQVLPQYIIKFSNQYGCGAMSPSLESILQQGKWSTKVEEEIRPVPPQRPCSMSRPTATVLWMGFLHAHLTDERLESDIRRFLSKFASDYMDGLKIQIVKGHFKKAHAILTKPIPRDLVRKLNSLHFEENGKVRTICVEDGHGSPGQKCPKFIAGYCRGRNLRYTHPCWCDHPKRPTERARFELTPVPLESAKGAELRDKFMASAPFHNGTPKLVGIKAIHNETLSRCHEEYRDYLTTKHMEEPAVQELYHGTNNNILDDLYKHGLQPPSDTQASEQCPISGGKGLCTTLCGNDCVHCTEKHEWKKCHMYGLGIYLADMAQKSHRYTSQPKFSKSGRQTYRMIVCSVLGKSFQVQGHLRQAAAMHDVVNVRALTDDIMDDMIEQCQPCSVSSGLGASIQGANGEIWGRVVGDEWDCWRLHTGRIAKKANEGYKWYWAPTAEVDCDNLEVAEKSDLLFVKGLGCACRPGFSVVNSEYIAFHPHQCLPKYEIEYELN